MFPNAGRSAAVFNRALTVSLKSTCLLLLSSMTIPLEVQAREREPEPVEEPGECPIDAPLRVASVDSLRHFEGLVGHCPETSVIESPASQANRPRIVPTGTTGQDLWFDDRYDENEARVIVTRASGESSEPRSTRPEALRVRRRMDGGAIAIVPAGADFPDPPSGQPTAIGLDTDLDGEVEAILALRPQSYTTPFDTMISDAARRHGVDPLLLHAVITQESRYRHDAVSHAGARGLMQVMPQTGRGLGVADAGQLFDARTNVDAGARLLRSLWERLDGNVDLVLAAYNAGEGAVRKNGMRIPPYRETQDYVVKVKANYVRLAGESGIAVGF